VPLASRGNGEERRKKIKESERNMKGGK